MQAADVVEVGGDDDGFLQGGFGDPHGAAVKLARKVIADDPLAEDGLVNEPEHGLTFVAQADEGDV